VQTDNIKVLDSCFNLTNKSNLIDSLLYDLIRFFDNLVVAYFLGLPCIYCSFAVIKDCCRCFGFKLPSELLERRFKKFMSKRSFWPCTRSIYDTLCTYSIIVGFFTPCLFFCLCFFVYACSTNVLVNKDWYILPLRFRVIVPPCTVCTSRKALQRQFYAAIVPVGLRSLRGEQEAYLVLSLAFKHVGWLWKNAKFACLLYPFSIQRCD